MRKNPFQPYYDRLNDGKCETADFPILVDLELTNFCNLHCRMCPTGCGNISRPQGFIDLKLLKNIVGQLPKETAIRLVRWGEPTLHPQFETIIEMLEYPNRHLIHVNTNGHWGAEDNWNRIFSLSLDSIKFSFQGTNAQEYKKWRGIDGFDYLVGNINRVCKIRNKYEYEKPFVQVGTTITENTTQEQKDKFRDKFNEVDLVTISQTRFDSGTPGNKPKCPEVYAKMSIDWDGIVTACCSDYDRLMVVGDATKQSLKDIWQGDSYRSIRNNLKSNIHDYYYLCKRCKL